MHSNCLAKLIYDKSGRISFETSDDWYYCSVGFDVELLSVGLDKDTIVTFVKGLNKADYKYLREASNAEKSILRDQFIKIFTNRLINDGYKVYVNKTDIFDDIIIVWLTFEKNGLRYNAINACTLKDYTLYFVGACGTEYTAPIALQTLNSLKIDGIKFISWVTN